MSVMMKRHYHMFGVTTTALFCLFSITLGMKAWLTWLTGGIFLGYVVPLAVHALYTYCLRASPDGVGYRAMTLFTSFAVYLAAPLLVDEFFVPGLLTFGEVSRCWLLYALGVYAMFKLFYKDLYIRF
jgi:hypothetical protein